MLKNKNILCIGFPTWEGDYLKTIVQIMTQFTLNNRVLYVDYEFTYKDILDAVIKNKPVPVKRMLGLSNPLRQLKTDVGGVVNVLTPPAVFPTNWIADEQKYSKIMAINAKKVEKSIKKALLKLNMQEELIVINAFNPFFGTHLARKFNDKLLLYYCYDEISAAAWAKNHGKQQEQLFIPKTDGVITTSQGLYNDKKALHHNTFLVKNGVDFKSFNKALNKSKTYIDKQSYKKIIGYIGSIDFRMDVELMQYVIKQFPEYLFVFIGKTNEKAVQNNLQKHKNVIFLGAKPITELPFFAADFDLGIIPFLKNEFTAKIYPLKINEYFALGKPVVMTDFGDMTDFKTHAAIVSTKEQFAKKLQEEIASDNTTKQAKRIEIARKNSWENRAEELSQIITKLL